MAQENTTAQGPPGQPPYPFVYFGPNANCTLELCPVESSVFGYRPSLAANYAFIACYAAAALAHVYLGVRWRSWSFMYCAVAGCLVCLAGYVGRIMLYHNPWSFIGFMIQIVLVGSGPVFFCAAIYVTLSKVILFLSPAHSRLPPRAYIWIFLSCDAVALTLQAVGGVLSTNTSGSSQVGVDLGLAGLGFQLATMTAFTLCLVDYLVRYFRRSSPSSPNAVDGRLRVFLAGLGAATLLILARSAYRVEELSHGYSGDSIRNEPLFIGLEGVLVVVAVFCLCIGHPGLILPRPDSKPGSMPSSDDDGMAATSRGPEKSR